MSLVELFPHWTPEERVERIAIAEALLRIDEDRYFPDARSTQNPPVADWVIWLILAGRGFGKTRTGAEWLVDTALAQPGAYAIAAPTTAAARDVCVEGESGVLAVLERRRRRPALWNRSIGEVVLANGSRLKLLSADEPDRARGWNFAGGWCDELAAWRYPDAWTQLQLAIRVGPNPRTVVTTTPRPVSLIRDLLGREDGSVQITRGSTFDNAANLAPAALAELHARYDGTRLGRQELYAEILDDIEGALWNAADLEAARMQMAPTLRRVTVAVDPPGGATECGIVVAGVAAGPCPCGGGADHVFVVADYSLAGPPSVWGARAVGAYREHQADRLVAELNFGADMVSHVVETVDRSVSVKTVRATRGKLQRAEPVQALYEQGRVHHVGVLAGLEAQMCEWVPGESGFSPDRVDALVWAVHELVLDGAGPASMVVPGGRAPVAGVRRSPGRGRVRVGTGR